MKMIENAANTKEVLQSPQIGEQCLDLLIGAALPLEHVCHVFAYGSGAIPQKGEDPSQKMVDFILVSNDSREFHRRNLELNPGHYSRLIRALASVPVLPFSKIDARHENIYWFQRDGFVLPKGARVFYNTMIPTRDRLIKYGVIETEDFEKDLLDWQWLYVAGRLHKPVLDIPPNYVSIQMPNRPISQAIADNQWMASLAALCMMQSSEFTMDNFLKRVVCHSYKGDVRMGWAEDCQKIDKLVAGAGDALRQIYIPILKKDNWVHIKSDSRIEHDYSTPALYHRLQMLPYFVQRDLCNSYYPQRHYRHYSSRLDIEELIFFISHQHDLAERLDSVLQGIVQRSSLHQSFKNALTAGFSSFAYIWPKLRKGYFRR